MSTKKRLAKSTLRNLRLQQRRKRITYNAPPEAVEALNRSGMDQTAAITFALLRADKDGWPGGVDEGA